MIKYDKLDGSPVKPTLELYGDSGIMLVNKVAVYCWVLRVVQFSPVKLWFCRGNLMAESPTYFQNKANNRLVKARSAFSKLESSIETLAVT